MEIQEEIPQGLFQVKGHLDKIKKRETETNFRVNKVEEYLKSFTLLSEKDAQALYEKLEKMNIPRLKANHLLKVVDLLPETVEDLKIVLQNYPLTISNDNMKKIIAAVGEFGKKK